jgi:DNA ligase-1
MTYEGRRVTADPVYAQSVIDRVVAEGRQLRQDEKAALFGPPVLLAHKFEDHEDLDPTGWWMSEKLDGVRAYWDGQEFVSRQGNIYNAPAWFKAALPKVPLDGELWMGRQMFQDTISVVKRDDWGPRAKDVMFVVFDAPASNLPFEDRVAYLEKLLAADQVHETHVKIHPHTLVASLEHVTAELKRLVALGAEGVMIRKPKSLYEAKRSHTLLKVKPFQDAEAELIGYEPGKKQHNGKVGGFILKMPSGKTFNLNAGTEERRVRPPKIGSLITYRFTELTKDGIPKCTSFVAVRDYE